MDFNDLENCPFCSEVLSFNKVSVYRQLGFCNNCGGVPFKCDKCDSFGVIPYNIADKGVGCQSCGETSTMYLSSPGKPA